MSGVSRIRAWAAVAGALAAGGTLVACAGSASQAPPASGGGSRAAATNGAVRYETFTPYAATGALAVPVADQLSGDCWTGSIAVPAPGVYRCIAGNQIEDPCFADTTQPLVSTVACVSDPWSPAHVLHLTTALPTTTAAGPTASPWALQLVDGTRCVAVTGTVGSVGSLDLNYSCGAGRAAGIVQNDGHTMVVDIGPASGTRFTAEPVATAWRG